MELVTDVYEHTFERITKDLARRYDGLLTSDEVAEIVAQGRAEMEPKSRHPEFVPILVEHYARDLLISRAHAQGRIAKEVPEILFVCQHNEGRSQMAAALAEHLSGGRVHVRSAGLEPTGHLNPHVVDVLAEVGVTLDKAYASTIREDVVNASDVIVLLGVPDADASGHRTLRWDVQDPHEQPADVVRQVRDDLCGRVAALLTDLQVPVVAPIDVAAAPVEPSRTSRLRWLPQRLAGVFG